MMMTFAVPDSVALPEALTVVAETAPTKPFCEVTGPEKVVEAMVLPLAQGFAPQSVQRQEGRPVCAADDALHEGYTRFWG